MQKCILAFVYNEINDINIENMTKLHTYPKSMNDENQINIH